MNLQSRPVHDGIRRAGYIGSGVAPVEIVTNEPMPSLVSGRPVDPAFIQDCADDAPAPDTPPHPRR